MFCDEMTTIAATPCFQANCQKRSLLMLSGPWAAMYALGTLYPSMKENKTESFLPSVFMQNRVSSPIWDITKIRYKIFSIWFLRKIRLTVTYKTDFHCTYLIVKLLPSPKHFTDKNVRQFWTFIKMSKGASNWSSFIIQKWLNMTRKLSFFFVI